jgi:hypothetical protein
MKLHIIQWISNKLKECLQRRIGFYIISMFIINQLYVNDENEKLVAHYREKNISQKMVVGATLLRKVNLQ